MYPDLIFQIIVGLIFVASQENVVAMTTTFRGLLLPSTTVMIIMQMLIV
jgi:hypothetical protein